MEALLSIDHQLLWWIHYHLVNPLVTNFVVLFTKLINSVLFWGILILVGLLCKRTRMATIVILLAAAVALAVGDGILKHIAQRTRPIFTGADVAPIVPLPKATSFSFPSGHSIVTAAMAAVAYMYHRKWGILAGIFALVVGFSRVYAFVHYPSDVVVGLLLGAIMGVIVYRLFRRYESWSVIQKIEHLTLLPFSRKKKEE